MTSLKSTLRRFLTDEEGATLAEYALLLGLVAVALIAVIGPFSTAIQGSFTKATDALNAAGSGSDG
jgi:pilus assembly protein Flp/PilA